MILESYTYEIRLIESRANDDIHWFIKRELYSVDVPDEMNWGPKSRKSFKQRTHPS